jgi:hypothetical protein
MRFFINGGSRPSTRAKGAACSLPLLPIRHATAEGSDLVRLLLNCHGLRSEVRIR